MRVKNLLIYLAIFLIALLFVHTVAAITGSIGNSRMVLRLEPGETIQKYVLIKNVNDVPVNVELTVSGDLVKDLKLDKANFTLQPGDEERAYFTIRAAKAGTTETKIQVKFSADEGSAVGLASTVVVITDENANIEEKNTEVNRSESNVSLNPRGTGNAVNDSGEGIPPAALLGILTFILVVVLVALFIYGSKKKRQKEVMRESVTKSKKSLRNV